MKTIVRIKFGSHLYGTETPASDVDYKSIFIPSAHDILLQRTKKSISSHRSKAESEKNYAGEIDEEAYSLQRYLQLAAEGQTVALDMLFATSWATIGTATEIWSEIQHNKHRLITRKSAAFLGYCRQQANKYGIKGSRVAAVENALELLDETCRLLSSHSKLGEIANAIESLCARNEHMSILDIEGAQDITGARRTVRHWEVCNRKMPYTQTIKASYEVMRRLYEEYGHRARQAEINLGVDWKALYHAVRVGRQAIELLLTGNVTFPRPEREHLLEIKTGQLEYKSVSEEIENLLHQVEVATEISNLPLSPDHQWIENFVTKVHFDVVSELG